MYDKSKLENNFLDDSDVSEMHERWTGVYAYILCAYLRLTDLNIIVWKKNSERIKERGF